MPQNPRFGLNREAPNHLHLVAPLHVFSKATPKQAETLKPPILNSLTLNPQTQKLNALKPQQRPRAPCAPRCRRLSLPSWGISRARRLSSHFWFMGPFRVSDSGLLRNVLAVLFYGVSGFPLRAQLWLRRGLGCADPENAYCIKATALGPETLNSKPQARP